LPITTDATTVHPSQERLLRSERLTTIDQNGI
jgi:hypothetical protein